MTHGSLLLLALLGSPHDQLGFGSPGTGMAGAAVADAPGASAAFYNPALIADRDDVEVLVGYGDTSIRLTLNGERQRIEAMRALSFGLAAPLQLGPARFGIAVALTVPDRRLYQVRVLPSDRPRFLLYDSRLQRMGADAAVGGSLRLGEVTAGIAGGVSILAGARGGGTTFYLRQGADYQLADAAVQNELPLLWTPAAAAFVRWGPWSLGITFRGELQFDLALGTLADIEVGALAGDIYTAAAAAAFYTPTKLTAGASWSHEDYGVHFAVEYHRWSVAPPMTPSAVLDVSFAGLVVDLPNGRPARQDLRDVFIPRLGGHSRWQLGEWQLCARAGAFYAPTPLRDEAEPVFLDSDTLGGALGAGLSTPALWGPFYEPLSLVVHVLGQRLARRRYPRQGATDPRPDIEIAGTVLTAGASLTLRF